ncbi:hypothetical protein N9J98_05355 [Flavobacteriaceae bacterium]|nr:hypothetical protein [Flavobacteriaceae bacterium]
MISPNPNSQAFSYHQLCSWCDVNGYLGIPCCSKYVLHSLKDSGVVNGCGGVFLIIIIVCF